MKAATKMFSIGDVLSLALRRRLSWDSSDACFGILIFMVGYDFDIMHDLDETADLCESYLIRQFPQFFTKRMRQEVKNLGKMLSVMKADDMGTKLLVCRYWSESQIGDYREMVAVRPVPRKEMREYHRGKERSAHRGDELENRLLPSAWVFQP